MLAKQCDLAREAETRFKELQGEMMSKSPKDREWCRGCKLLDENNQALPFLKRLRHAIDKHEKFKRSHEKVVSLEDEELYQTRREVDYGE